MSSEKPTQGVSDPKLQAMKDRILTHMTSDHADSLALYLQHYCLIPSSQAPINPPPPTGTLKLEDVTLDHMIISHPSGRNVIQIKPPMKSMSEARERLIEMHKECLRGLDLADFKVDRWVPPNKAWQWLTHFSVFMTLFTFIFWPTSAFIPENGQFPALFWGFGGLANFLPRIAVAFKPYVLVLTIAIHTGEALWFSRTRLRKYWVQRFTGLWWKWTATAFLGGVAGIWRFDEYVESIEKERSAKGPGKH